MKETLLFLSTIFAMPMMAQQANDIQVVRELFSGNSGKIELVKDAEGRLGKRMTLANGKQSSSMKAPKRNEATYTMYEDFGGWDGETVDWIPEGWTEINSDDPIVQANPSANTWHVDSNSMGMFQEPEHSNYFAEICFGMSDDYTEFANQDEWLCTPVITVGENTQLEYSASFTPFFMFVTDYFDWDNLAFTQRVCAASVQVWLKDGDADWVMIHDIFDDWKDASDDDIFDDGLNSYWRYYFEDLSNYAGHDVQFAFRYKGCNGDTWHIDYVAVSKNEPEAPVVAEYAQTPEGEPCVAAKFNEQKTCFYDVHNYNKVDVTLVDANGNSFDIVKTSDNYCLADYSCDVTSFILANELEAGNYTLTIPVGAMVIDEADEYVFNTEDYVLNFDVDADAAPAKLANRGTADGIKNVADKSDSVKKALHNGKIVIVKGENEYNVAGALLK